MRYFLVMYAVTPLAKGLVLTIQANRLEMIVILLMIQYSLILIWIGSDWVISPIRCAKLVFSVFVSCDDGNRQTGQSVI